MTIAMTMRPDLLAAQATLNSAQESVRAARLQRFPTIVGTADDGPVSISQSGGTYANSRSVGVSLSVPIFDGGVIRAQTESALAQAASAEANYDAAALAVSQTVEQAVLGLSTAQSGLAAATVELSQAHTVIDVTNAQYKAGVTTLPLLLNAQVGLTKAETDYVVAVYTYKTAQQALRFAEGTNGTP
jgi:outer membrane protein